MRGCVCMSREGRGKEGEQREIKRLLEERK